MWRCQVSLAYKFGQLFSQLYHFPKLFSFFPFWFQVFGGRKRFQREKLKKKKNLAHVSMMERIGILNGNFNIKLEASRSLNTFWEHKFHCLSSFFLNQTKENNQLTLLLLSFIFSSFLFLSTSSKQFFDHINHWASNGKQNTVLLECSYSNYLAHQKCVSYEFKALFFPWPRFSTFIINRDSDSNITIIQTLIIRGKKKKSRHQKIMNFLPWTTPTSKQPKNQQTQSTAMKRKHRK